MYNSWSKVLTFLSETLGLRMEASEQRWRVPHGQPRPDDSVGNRHRIRGSPCTTSLHLVLLSLLTETSLPLPKEDTDVDNRQSRSRATCRGITWAATSSMSQFNSPHQITPGQQVTVRAQMQDDTGRHWQSHAIFVADERGEVDVATQRPLAGTYADIDAMGLFWSMRLDPSEQEDTGFAKIGTTPLETRITAEIEGTPTASTTFARLFIAPGTVAIPVREQGLAGTLFLPKGAGPFPASLS